MRKLSIKYQFCLALAACLVGFVCCRQATMQTDDASAAEEEPKPEMTQWAKSFFGPNGYEDNQGRSSMVERNDREYPVTNSSLPDGVFIDWRRTNCFNPPNDQGSCKSCFVFTVMSLYEWAYCMMHGNRIDFSEQYVVDCVSQMGINVCNDGMRYTDVFDFVNEYGFELTMFYPYKGGQHDCPHSNLTKTKKKRGLIHLNKPQLRMIHLSQFDEELKNGPIVASFTCGERFNNYRSGIDPGVRYTNWFPHGMLIVGSGRENGEEYWILRNSWGENWGENGYYRLKKCNECYFNNGYGWVLEGSLVSDNAQTALNGFFSNQLIFFKNLYYDWGLMSEKLTVKEEPVIPWKEVSQLMSRFVQSITYH